MTDHNDDTPPGTGEGEQKPTGEVIHFNPWRDFNDAPLQEDPFGVEPDADTVSHGEGQELRGECRGFGAVASVFNR